MAARRLGYDSVNVPALPSDGALYPAYVDGRLYGHNYDEVHARFPHKQLVAITVTGEHLDAAVGDVEAGDMTIEHGADWAARKLAAKLGTPTLYSFAANLSAMKAAVHARGLTGKVLYGVADYDGSPRLPRDRSVMFKQFLGYPGAKGARGTSPGAYDVSVFRYVWPGVDPAVPAWFTRPLALHSVGRDVLALKARLHALGAPVRMSMRVPVLGGAADRNVKFFQRRRSLPVTGVVDRVTAHALLHG